MIEETMSSIKQLLAGRTVEVSFVCLDPGWRMLVA